MVIHYLEKSFGSVHNRIAVPRLQMVEFFPVYWYRGNLKLLIKDMALSVQGRVYSTELCRTS